MFEINRGQTDDPVLASLPVLIDQRRSGNFKFSCRRRSLLQYLGQVDKVGICRIRWRESINAHSMKHLKTEENLSNRRKPINAHSMKNLKTGENLSNRRNRRKPINAYSMKNLKTGCKMFRYL